MQLRMWVLVVTLAALTPRGDADPAPDRMAKLVGLAHVWIEAKVAHPAMLRGDVDLDGAMITAIPEVEAATTKAAYAAAITHLLAKFYPYLELVMGWDDQLPIAIAATEGATDAMQYRDALSAFGVQLHDGHIHVYSTKPEPSGTPAIELRFVGKRAIITAAWDAHARVGDEVVSIDGVPIAKRFADSMRVTAGGTDTGRENLALGRALAGPVDRPAALEVRGADAKLRTLELSRAPVARPEAPHFKLLPGNLGYVDLRALTPDEVDAMFAALGKTKGLVLDMRGYPRGTAWPMTPYLNVKHARYNATFLQPTVDAGETSSRSWFQQELVQDASKPLYRGRLAVLIDDRAISQAEHSCLIFESAASPAFIGSHTHGTNGDVTAMRLPGGLRMWFTGQAVRHADGRQLQQLGIQPTIAIEPTIAGLRAGKDEVLARGLAFVETGR
jgi:hypothetical protein